MMKNLAVILVFLMAIFASCQMNNLPPNPGIPGGGPIGKAGETFAGYSEPTSLTVSSSTITFTVGETEKIFTPSVTGEQYVYKIGYALDVPTNSWKEFKFDQDTVGLSNWIKGNASTTLTIQLSDLSINVDQTKDLYVIAYACTKPDSAWDCHENRWMIRNLTAKVIAAEAAVPACGNNLIEGTEECDGTNLAEQTCITKGFASGTLTCKEDCTFDTTACVGACVDTAWTPDSTCGNNLVEGTEVCDGNSQSCTAADGSAGTQTCNELCSGFGECIKTQTQICKDSDSGLDFYRQGSAQRKTITGLWVGSLDICNPANPTVQLNERYCNLTGLVSTVTVSCPNGCSNGACMSYLSTKCGTFTQTSNCGTTRTATGTLTCTSGQECTNNACVYTTPVLTATSSTYNSIALSWTAVPGTSSYKIYLQTNPAANFYSITSVQSPATTYTVNGMQSGVTYYFKVTAVNSAGVESEKSNMASATPPAAPVYVCGNNLIEGTETCDGTNLAGQTCITQGFVSGTLSCSSGCTGFDTSLCVNIPSTPTGLAATAVSPTDIDLTWNAVSGAASYKIYGDQNADFTHLVGTKSAPSTSFSDSGLQKGTIYYYKVSAVNAAGESAKSEYAAVTTLREITVISATYGMNYWQYYNAAADNSFADISAKCNGKTSCPYYIDYLVIGDPVPGYPKRLDVAWACTGETEPRTFSVSQEANGKSLTLSCD